MDSANTEKASPNSDMNFEPQKFFIGLMDFFTILLPGALFTYLVEEKSWVWFFGAKLKPTGPEGWIVFLVSSYLLGHFIFLLGVWWDELYDAIWGRTLNKRIQRLARTGHLTCLLQRALLWLAFKNENDLAMERVKKIKGNYLKSLQSKDAINTFQWAKARLALEKPDALASVQRFEADSKFFRSLAVVLLLVLVFFLPVVPGKWWCTLLGCVVLWPMAFWRYVEQRHKATNQAYWFIITMEGQRGKVSIPPRTFEADEPTHAGGVVFKMQGGTAKFLLVEAKKNPDELVLPKGHVELDELHKEAAVREVYEEAGVWACIEAEIEDKPIPVNGEKIPVRFFLMEAIEERRSMEPLRGHKWLPLDEAKEKATYPETRDLLEAAKQLMETSRSPRT
jgi:8-oxo-dGTP pyrophosphatase MutT (NUDIX family)